MPDRLFLDSNVVVYAWDRNEPEKQRQAIRLLDLLTARRAATISTQVLGEFFRVATGRLRWPLTPAQALEGLETYTRLWEVVPITPDIVIAAARGVVDHQLAYWDAQIWAAARLNGIPAVVSEDFEDERVVENVRFLNPFLPSFRLDAALGET